MTENQYKILLDINRQKFSGSLDMEQVKKYHLQAVIDKDKLSVLGRDTTDINEYISELNKIILE